jgi:phosphatidylserine/phosphatidylglycerophosphate/cardiolipin synthase-like enzyme
MANSSSPLRLALILLCAIATLGVSDCTGEASLGDSADATGGDDAFGSGDTDGAGTGAGESSLAELAGDCAPVAFLSCGVPVSADSSDPNSGHTTVLDFYPVTVGNYSGPEVAYAWRAQTSEEVTWSLQDPQPTVVNHDLFVLHGEAVCKGESAIARGFNSVTFDAVAGDLYFLVVDGFDGDAGPYTVSLECTGGAVDPGNPGGGGEAHTASAEVIFSPQPYQDSHLVRTAELIDAAQHSIDLAMYSFRDNRIIDALRNASQRGLRIRAVLESARNDRSNPEGSRSAQLEEMGIEVRWVNKIMHHKFALIDGPRSSAEDADQGVLVSGSANWSYSAGTRYDENTVISFGDRLLNLRFQSEFNYIWSNSRNFDWNESIEAVPAEAITASDLASALGSDALFTSDNFRITNSSTYGPTFRLDGADSEAIRGPLAVFIESATASIQVASGHLRSRQIVDALLRAFEANPGLDIQVYLDGQEYTSLGYYEDEVADYETCLDEATTDTQRYHCENMGVHFGHLLHHRGIPLRYKYYSYRWHYSYAVQMHHKYVIVDGETVATGSYNFSNNAEHQTLENLVFYEAEQYPALVASFVGNFAAIWNTGAGPTYSSLMDQIQGDSVSFPIVFDSMALDWQQVSDLKAAIRAECPDINSEPFRTRPQDHQLCER